MEERSLKIQVHEGYEIDKEKSTFENIVFKQKKEVKRWEDLKSIKGCYINNDSMILGRYNCPVISEYRNVFATEKQAKSALAFAQITQLLPYYEGYMRFQKDVSNFQINYDFDDKQFSVCSWRTTAFSQFYFSTRESAEEFIKNNEDLLRQYFMLD